MFADQAHPFHIALVGLLAAAAGAAPAHSQTPMQGVPAACAGEPLPGRLLSVGPGRDLQVRLATRDQVFRLVDIEAPAGAADELRHALDSWRGRSVRLHPATAIPDRWGRLPAHVELLPATPGSPPAAGLWLQRALVRAGLAMVRPEQQRRGCAAALYPAEAAARRGRLGLWADPDNGVRMAADPGLRKLAAGYRIVAGIVVSVGATEHTHYLNFGRDWSSDFTVTVPAQRRSIWPAGEAEPDRLAGRYVRVRGWLRQWNGAVIEVTRPDEIEVVGDSDH